MTVNRSDIFVLMALLDPFRPNFLGPFLDFQYPRALPPPPPFTYNYFYLSPVIYLWFKMTCYWRALFIREGLIHHISDVDDILTSRSDLVKLGDTLKHVVLLRI